MSDSAETISVAGKFLRLGEHNWLLKGVSYGPFAGADSLPPPETVEADLDKIVDLGANTLRIYAPPPLWFLEACANHGLRVIIGLQWPAHTDFLRDRRAAREIIRNARDTVIRLRGAPAVLGFFVGNEVPATLVRWLGPARVRRFLERLIDAVRQANPEALYAYATFPSTEYLNPGNADFIAYNVYLERRQDFEAYLARLQNIAGNQPLIISEFGLDTGRHGESAQAETMTWAWEAALQAGAAGQILFAFTDEWFTAGEEQVRWKFGLVGRDRREKESFAALSAWLPNVHRPAQGVRLALLPRLSVIVCTHNGARTLREALASLQHLAYPDYETILVDDGSTDAVPEIAREFREVRPIRIEHSGLSAARNKGAREATGEILVFMDDDCIAQEDWLTYLALAFRRDRVGAAGGPNIPPPVRGIVRAAIAAAPGGPSHVLIGDSDAEHLPGCNLAVTKAAWDEVGGFDTRFWTAGDDVDFCWRLLDHGYRIAFHPGAWLWHHRRATVRAYLQQQRGYGEAEALLMSRHPHRFGKIGGARWRGIIYEPSAMARQPAGGLIYGGVFGHALFQFLYASPRSSGSYIVTSFPWAMAAGLVGLGAFWYPWLSVPALVMVSVPVWVALETATRSRPMPGRRQAAGRLVLFFLLVAQPFVRGAARFFSCVRRRAYPGGPWLAGRLIRWPHWRRRKSVGELALWNEHGRDRDALIAAVIEELKGASWSVLAGDEWVDWDFEIRRSPWWIVRITSVTEIHAQARRLTRVRLATRATGLTMGLAGSLVILLPAVAWYSRVTGLWCLALTFLCWLALEFQHGAFAAQVLRLISHCARGLGLRRLDEDREAERAADEALAAEARAAEAADAAESTDSPARRDG